VRVLAVDTATEVCGVALASEAGVLAHERIDQGSTHARVLMGTIQTILGRCDIGLADLDGLVVTQGPGSFTGLRIGISAVKGMAAATGLPVVGVSTLAVLAHQAAENAGWVCPMIDARRREVYWSLYRRKDGAWQRTQEERAGSAGQAAACAPEACLFIGSGAQLYRQTIIEQAQLPARFAEAADNALNPAVVARLGLERLRRGEQESLDQFTPVYLRKSDAEIGRHAKAGL